MLTLTNKYQQNVYRLKECISMYVIIIHLIQFLGHRFEIRFYSSMFQYNLHDHNGGTWEGYFSDFGIKNPPKDMI